MAQKDPERFLDPSKLQGLTMQVGQITAHAAALKIDAGMIIKDGCMLVAPEQLTAGGRTARWRQLYPARELVHAAVRELRAAADRLDAEWERTEDGLCGLSSGRDQLRRVP